MNGTVADQVAAPRGDVGAHGLQRRPPAPVPEEAGQEERESRARSRTLKRAGHRAYYSTGSRWLRTRRCTPAGSAARSCARSSARSSARTAGTRATAPTPDLRAAVVTIDEALRQATADAARGVVTFPGDLHGFPGTVHGGAVAAAFHRLTLPRPPVALRVELLRGVPDGDAARPPHRQRRRNRAALAPPGRPAARRGHSPPRRDHGAGRPVPPDRVGDGQRRPGGGAGYRDVRGVRLDEPAGARRPLPLERPIPLARVRSAPDLSRARAGTHPALALILLDELAWWLGALAQQECGVTTDVHVTLFDRAPPGADARPRGPHRRRERRRRARSLLPDARGAPRARRGAPGERRGRASPGAGPIRGVWSSPFSPPPRSRSSPAGFRAPATWPGRPAHPRARSNRTPPSYGPWSDPPGRFRLQTRAIVVKMHGEAPGIVKNIIVYSRELKAQNLYPRRIVSPPVTQQVLPRPNGDARPASAR